MLPMKCIQPPCMNMDVKTVPHALMGEAMSTFTGPPWRQKPCALQHPPGGKLGRYDAVLVVEAEDIEIAESDR